jgi:hypothetical protein
MKFLIIAFLVLAAFGWVAVAIIGIALEIMIWVLIAGAVLIGGGWLMRKLSGGIKRLR